MASCCRYFTPKEDGKFTALWFYVVPLDEHTTRVINHAVIVQPLPTLVKKLAAARPRWIDHLLLNEIFDGDMAYLAKVCLCGEYHSSLSSILRIAKSVQPLPKMAKRSGHAENDISLLLRRTWFILRR